MCAGKIFNKNNTSSTSKLKENLLINENVPPQMTFFRFSYKFKYLLF